MILMNHMICEMTPNSLKNVLSKTKYINYPDIFIDSTGYQKTKWPDVKNTLNSFNYKLSYCSNHAKESNCIYIFKHSKNFKIKKKNIILNKFIRLIPFYNNFKNFANEIRRVLYEIFFYEKIKQNFIYKKLFKEDNKYSYNDIIELYKKNNWGYQSQADIFEKNINTK